MESHASTSNDFNALDDETRQPCHAIPDVLNNTLMRQEIEDAGPRMEALKEDEGQSDNVSDQNQTKPIEVTGQEASLQSTSYRPLPRGKLYHVFFSHCREDSDWVIDVMKRLESPEYGFKCCFADRDFDLGVPVFQNITKCILSSKRTVIVMSPEFLKSPWCSYETRITLEMDLDTRNRLLIPVMLRNCKTPDFIGRLTYIEVENEHFWNRFVSALEEDDSQNTLASETVGSSAIMSCSPFQFNPHYTNTEEIVQVPISSCCSKCDTELLPSELMRYGLQISVDEYRDIVTTISNLFYVKYRGCFNKVPWLVLFFSVVPIAVMFAVVAVESYPYRYQDSYLFPMIFSLSLAAVGVMLPIIHYSCTLKAARSFPKALEAANKIASARNLMVSVKDYGCCNCSCDRMAIRFYYFDWKPCISQLKCFLQPPTETPSNEELIDVNREDAVLLESADDLSIAVEDEIENRAIDLLIRHSTEYGQLLVARRSVAPSEQRHTRQGECLCQFVESILLSGRTSCLDRIFGTGSRRPWRRYCSF